jgi:hypothetical protein
MGRPDSEKRIEIVGKICLSTQAMTKDRLACFSGFVPGLGS